MERFLQYLDDLDDLYGVLGLVYERLRVLFLALLAVGMVLTVALGAVVLAIVHPPLALATSTLLFVLLLYRSATLPHHGSVLPI